MPSVYPRSIALPFVASARIKPSLNSCWNDISWILLSLWNNLFDAGAGWVEAANGGQVIDYQGLYFEGSPNPDANLFYLQANGTGEVNGPFIFELNLP